MPTTLTQHEPQEGSIEPRISVQLRLRPSIYSKARDWAKREGIPIGKVVEDCIECYEQNN